MLQHPSNKMTHAELITSYNASLRLLPSRRHFDFVLNFFSWLHRLGSDSAKTKMDIANLAVVIGHNLFHGFGDDATSLDEVPLLNKATEFLIQNISQMAGRTAELAHFAHRMTDTEVDTKFKKLTTFGMARRRSLHMVMNVTSTVVQAAGAAGAAMGTAVGRAGRMIRRNSLHAPANLKDLAAETEAAAAASVSEQTVPDGSKRRRRNSLSRKGSGSLSVSSDSGSDLSQPDEPLFADQPRSRPRGSSIGGRRSIGSAQTRRTTNGSAQKSTREAASAKGTPGRMIANRSAAKPITPYRSARAGKRLNLRTAPPEAQRDAPTLALRPTVRKTMPLAECNQQFEQMAFRSKLMRSDPHEGENILALELQGTSPQESGMYSQNGYVMHNPQKLTYAPISHSFNHAGKVSFSSKSRKPHNTQSRQICSVFGHYE